jgi:hypothetical protein
MRDVLARVLTRPATGTTTSRTNAVHGDPAAAAYDDRPGSPPWDRTGLVDLFWFRVHPIIKLCCSIPSVHKGRMHMLLFGSATHDTRTQRGAFSGTVRTHHNTTGTRLLIPDVVVASIRRHMRAKISRANRSVRPTALQRYDMPSHVRLFSSSEDEVLSVTDPWSSGACSRYAEDLSRVGSNFTGRDATAKTVFWSERSHAAAAATTCHVVGHCHRLLTKSRKRKCLRFITVKFKLWVLPLVTQKRDFVWDKVSGKVFKI